jgi:hypothetical protein
VDAEFLGYDGSTWKKLTPNWINIEEYGASTGESGANNVTAIENAVAAMSEGDTLFIPSGDYTITNLELDLPDNSNVYMQGRFTSSSAGIAVLIGPASGDETFRLNIQGLRVWQTNTPHPEAGTTGVVLRNLYECYIQFKQVDGFEYGIRLLGDATGCVYNEIHLGRTVDNKISLDLYTANNGWTNENHFYGGRFSWTSSLHSDDTYIHVYIEDAFYIINNNRFYNLSLEGVDTSGENSPYSILCEGAYNYFNMFRFEMSSHVLKFTSNSSHNVILYGRGFWGPVDIGDQEYIDEGVYNKAHGASVTELHGGSTSGVLRLLNHSSAAYPLMKFLNTTGADTGGVTGSGQVQATSDGVATRVVAGTVSDANFTVDTNGLLAIDSSNGRLYFRYGGGWHYCAQDAGFQIPADETEGLSVGDIVIGKVNEKLNDGALHARYIKLEDALKELGIYSEKEV